MGSILEWEENLFLGLKALHRLAFRRPDALKKQRARVTLASVRYELFLLARMIQGHHVDLFETQQPFLCSQLFVFLPSEFSVGESREINLELFRLKTVLGSLMVKEFALGLNDQRPVKEWICLWEDQLPNLGSRVEFLENALTSEILWSLMGEPFQGGHEVDQSHLKSTQADLKNSDEAEQKDSITEIEGRGQIDVKTIESNDEQSVESEMPVHTFEKAETLEEYNGIQRKTDEEDELKDHEEALHALEMTHLLRSQERPRSIYRADVILEAFSSDVHAPPSDGIPYPEWDYKKKKFKPSWCFVKETVQEKSSFDWVEKTERQHQSVILNLRKKISSLVNQSTKVRRQPSGSDLDIDAVVNARVDHITGHAPSENIYIQEKQHFFDAAILILMDQSYSTDSWLANYRTLDTIVESLFCMGEVMNDWVDNFAVAGFSSHTRRHCEFNIIKSFEAPWRTRRATLGSIQPIGYTRIGPALRHAQELLVKHVAERRMIILITDGRPCDYDRYEGNYGVQDVRKAVATGDENGILTHAFTIDSRAREQLPRMFKRHQYDVIPKVQDLAGGLCRCILRLRTEY